MPVQERSNHADLNKGPLREAIEAAVEENAVFYRGVTSDGHLFFERKDRTEPLSQIAAANLARAIVGNIRNLGNVDGTDMAARLKNIKGLRIA
jgi:hypothetical protein